MKSHCKLSSLPYFLLFPAAIQVPPSQKLSDPALKCPSDEVCIDLPARLSESLKDSKLDSSSQPTMSKQTQPGLMAFAPQPPQDPGWGSEHTVPCTSNRPIILPQGFIQLHTTPLSFGKIRLSHVAHDSCLCPTNLSEIRC